MKAVFGILMIGALAIVVAAQPDGTPKVMAELSMGSQAVKGQPFSADTVSESVQTLSDGNRIVQTSSGKIYRNGEGKVRREMTGGSGGFAYTVGGGVSIMDPFGRQNVWLDSEGRTARTMTMVAPAELRIRESQLTGEQRKAVEKIRELKGVGEGKGIGEGKGVGQAGEERKKVETITATTVITPDGAAPVAIARGLATSTGNWFVGAPGDSKWETKNDDLGTNTIDGVVCEGNRRTTTIPAGSIGNERPIEITYERWYSKELGMVVLSKHNDPRFGEQTYTLKNIVRSEPEPSLFTVPTGFKMLSPEPGGMFTVRVKSPTTPTPAQAPRQP